MGAYDACRNICDLQVEIQLLRVLGARPTVIGLRAVLADPSSDDLYLILDLADAGSLMDYNESSCTFNCRAAGGGVLPIELARQCLGDLLEALADLRSLGIAHRDIKVGIDRDIRLPLL